MLIGNSDGLLAAVNKSACRVLCDVDIMELWYARIWVLIGLWFEC